ncbi:MAG TPA: hypothetical protein VGD64_08720 [Acidisarcina sp.]
MYRFLTLIALFCVSLPIGLSVAGCGRNYSAYCANTGFGKKVTDVDTIDLEPKLTGLSLSFGQTGSLNVPQAYGCNHNTVEVAHFLYGSDNKSIADISPTGVICAGTWNRTSGGGITDYTICTPPATSGTALITAQGGGATSNPVTVYVHPPVTNATVNSNGSCLSQNMTSQLDATAYTNGSTTMPFCAPYGNSSNGFNSCSNNPVNGVPDCICNLGHLNYIPQNGGVLKIDQNGVATALFPGTSLIAASISGVSFNAGYFATCSPQKITLSVPPGDVNSAGIVTVTGTTPVQVTETVIDTNGNPITGLNLNFTSTNPQQIAVSSIGSVSTSFPGVAQINAVCEPPTCNPAPINKIGQYGGTGLPVTSSNTLTFQSPGLSGTLLWLASPYSPFFTHFDLSLSNLSTPVKMPYTPNSMVLDPATLNLYFGSYRELMVYNASGNTLSREDTTVPGVVLGVSPQGTTVVICDQVRQLIYLYSPAGGIQSTIGGLATKVAFSADSATVYLTGPDSLYVHNVTTGWSTYTIPTAQKVPATCPLDNSGTMPYCAPDVTTTNPHVGAFLSGNSTTARSYCYDGSANPPYFPATTDVDPATDRLTATANGKHVIGASATPATLTDIFTALPVGACPNNTPVQLGTNVVQAALPGMPAAIDQVVTSYDSSLAFITYSASTTALAGGAPGAILPAYMPSTNPGTPGTIAPVTLTGGATAPLAGVFSPDNSQFFVGTAGDDLVHVIDVKSLTDTSTINPSLPDANGNPVPAVFLAARPRKVG